MTKLYKLTTQDHKTRPGYLEEVTWGEGVSHTANGPKHKLCSSGVIHAYLCPKIAAFMNPIHGVYSDPILWEAEGDIVAQDHFKVGVKTLTTLRIIPLPNLTPEDKVTIAIRCAKLVYKTIEWNIWAANWLNKIDRTAAAAYAASRAAFAAAYADAVHAAAAAAADASAAAYAASRADASAFAAVHAAAAAAYAADAAADATTITSLISFYGA